MHIDTLTFTYPFPESPYKITRDSQTANYPVMTYGLPESLSRVFEYKDRGKGMNGYKFSFEHEQTGHIIAITFDKPRQRIMHHLTGDSLRVYRKLQPENLGALLNMARSQMSSVTRIDIAIDYINEAVTVDEVATDIENATVRRFNSAPKIYGSHINGKYRIETIYCGSPQSKIRLKIYDKLIEQTEKKREIDANIKSWVRAEIQVKGTRAKDVLNMVCNDDINGLRGFFNAFVNIPLWGCDHYTDIPEETKEKDTIAWLLNTVAPTLARIATDNENIIQAFNEAVKQNMNHEKNKRTTARQNNRPIE